jgi:hypothetical protein
VGALVTAGAATPVIVAAASAFDAEAWQFERWEAEIERLYAQAELIDDTDITDTMFDRARLLDEQIRAVPARDRRAVAVKARSLVRYADDFDTQLSAVARHLAAFADGRTG